MKEQININNIKFIIPFTNGYYVFTKKNSKKYFMAYRRYLSTNSIRIKNIIKNSINYNLLFNYYYPIKEHNQNIDIYITKLDIPIVLNNEFKNYGYTDSNGLKMSFKLKTYTIRNRKVVMVLTPQNYINLINKLKKKMNKEKNYFFKLFKKTNYGEILYKNLNGLSKLFIGTSNYITHPKKIFKNKIQFYHSPYIYGCMCLFRTIYTKAISKYLNCSLLSEPTFNTVQYQCLEDMESKEEKCDLNLHYDISKAALNNQVIGFNAFGKKYIIFGKYIKTNMELNNKILISENDIYALFRVKMVGSYGINGVPLPSKRKKLKWIPKHGVKLISKKNECYFWRLMIENDEIYKKIPEEIITRLQELALKLTTILNNVFKN